MIANNLSERIICEKFGREYFGRAEAAGSKAKSTIFVSNDKKARNRECNVYKIAGSIYGFARMINNEILIFFV